MPEKKMIATLRKALDGERDPDRRLSLETQIVILLLLVELKRAITKVDALLEHELQAL